MTPDFVNQKPADSAAATARLINGLPYEERVEAVLQQAGLLVSLARIAPTFSANTRKSEPLNDWFLRTYFDELVNAVDLQPEQQEAARIEARSILDREIDARNRIEVQKWKDEHPNRPRSIAEAARRHPEGSFERALRANP